MISDEELLEIEKRLGHALSERNGPNARLLLEYDVPALLKDANELREALQTAMGALADIAGMSDREVADDIPRKKARRIYDSLPKLL